jgi:large subunit ribosomal protein L22
MQEYNGFVQATARLRNCRMSARKMRLVADIIRGKQVDKAFGILKFTKNEGGRWLEKVLHSAVANWTVLSGEEDADDYGLVIKELWIDAAPLLKRFRPAPHGRAHRIHKHSCHVNMVIGNVIRLETDSDSVEVEEVVQNA